MWQVTDNKTESLDPNIFDYMSLHIIARLKDEDGSIPFEIQVRTIAQDAWASISHYLDYKKTEGVPEELRRNFYALNGLFYIADFNFSLLKKELDIGKFKSRFRSKFKSTPKLTIRLPELD